MCIYIFIYYFSSAFLIFFLIKSVVLRQLKIMDILNSLYGLLEGKSALILGVEFLNYNAMLCVMAFKLCGAYIYRYR